VLRRLLDALPRVGLGRAGGCLRGALADLRTDVDDDQLLDELGPLGREVDRVTAAHREADQHERGHAELVEDPADVVEGGDGVVGVGRVAVTVTALVHGVDVEMRLERDAQRVPRVRVPGEAVQQQQRRAPLTAPVEDVESQAVDGQEAIERAQEIHRDVLRRPWRGTRSGVD